MREGLIDDLKHMYRNYEICGSGESKIAKLLAESADTLMDLSERLRVAEMRRDIVSVCTNDECRKHFADCGLTYSDVTEGDILTLTMLLNREIKKSVASREASVDTIRLSPKIDIKTNDNGTIITCFLYMNSHYFEKRECISFNRDGWIGFAGWADTGNSNPIRRAFLEWCDIVAEQKKQVEALEEST